MEQKFEMVAKTFQGLEDVLSEELRAMGAENVMPGRRMVSFTGNLELLYRANLSSRTALRILKPFFKFKAGDPDALYEQIKEYDWSTILSPDKTFCIDTVANSDEFKHSRFVTYRVKDGIVDWFRDRYGEECRPGVRLQDADVMINVHINGHDVTLSLDSSGESLHKRGYRVAQTEAPINEVLAAGIILRSGWRGDCPLVDPMCGSGTFLIEAALIAANINPGIYRKGFAFERWPDFDGELFDRLYNDDSAEREVKFKIHGADISPKAIDIATANIKSAGVGKYIELERKPISAWEEAPKPAGVLVTNPPYGERISAPDMDALYQTIGQKLKRVFTGYHVWIIGYRDEYFAKIGLAPSEKIPMLNGSLECSLREYIIFEGDRKSFVSRGGKIGKGAERPERGPRHGSGDGRDRFDRRDSRGADRGRRPAAQGDSRSRFVKPAPAPVSDIESENPLAKRRNPDALKMLRGRQPQLPPQEGPIMRSRGWKKKS
ncbi:MAG: RNA methyltransferase [Muribaculaceae bacterium]|nr:RNA methyltransferase [Muribaculaceae bacterium]